MKQCIGSESGRTDDLIVVLDGGSSRLEHAERFRQQVLDEHPLPSRPLEPADLLIRCPRALPPPQPMPELLRGYDTVTQITVLANWLQHRQAPVPQRIWIATDPDHTAHVQPALIIAWGITTIALGVAIIVIAMHPVTEPSQIMPNSSTTADSVVTLPVTTIALQTEIAELARLLDDAQSALGDRDREIASAMAELATQPTAIATYIHTLRQRGINAHLMKNTHNTIGGIIIDSQQAGIMLLAQPLELPAKPMLVGLQG